MHVLPGVQCNINGKCEKVNQIQWDIKLKDMRHGRLTCAAVNLGWNLETIVYSSLDFTLRKPGSEFRIICNSH